MSPAWGSTGGSPLSRAVRPSRGVLVAYACASIIGALIAVPPGSRLLTVALACALPTAAGVVVLFGCVRAVAAVRGSRPLVTIGELIGCAIAAGTVRGTVLFLVETRAGLQPGAPAAQIVSSALSATVWVVIAALVFDSNRIYRERYRAMVLQRALSARAEGSAPHDRELLPAVAEMKAALVGVAEGVTDDPTPEQLRAVSSAIRLEIEERLRPLSHRLWFGHDEHEPQPRWTRLMRDGLAAFTVPAAFVVCAWAVASFVGGIALFGFERGMAAALMSAAVLAIALAIGKWAVGRRPGPAAGVAACLLASVATVVVPDRLLQLAGVSSELDWARPLPYLIMVAPGLLIGGSAAVRLASADRDVVLAIAGRQPGSIPSASENRQAAAFLHNSLQSELVGLAMQLDAAAEAGEASEATAALERLHGLLARSVSDDFAALRSDPAQRLRQAAEAWRGICDIEVDLDPAAAADGRLPAAVQVCEELMANAVRHGGATKAEVRLHALADGLEVSLTSDQGPPEVGEPGLGTGFMAGVGASACEVDQAGGRTRLRTVIR